MSKPYYELPGNKMNPHTYFYRVAAVPMVKFVAITYVTFHALDYTWKYLDSHR